MDNGKNNGRPDIREQLLSRAVMVNYIALASLILSLLCAFIVAIAAIVENYPPGMLVVLAVIIVASLHYYVLRSISMSLKTTAELMKKIGDVEKKLH